ncbi:MAG TPA: sporulation YhaL family protein [Virgibacillus sp.]|nr:sporulation YhaL family protein [Virgibacillus sp.]
MMIFGIPWWVFMMILFIFFSGYMAFRAMQAEQKLEQHFIEKEGEVYIERIKEEQERKRQQKERMTN